MNTTQIHQFLRDIAAHNSREWFQDHRAEYQAARQSFEHDVQQAIAAIAAFDPTVAHITLRDATYRFNRDTRFSPDKSPYKRHFGAYIAAHGKKALHGGYYLHLEPGHCLLACGGYYLPTNILTSCRNEIMANIRQWRDVVEAPQFLQLFGKPGSGVFEQSSNGFGLQHLKTCPSGFPRDYEHLHYLRMKDYCCWHAVADDFFDDPQTWIPEMQRIFQVAKPMMDFINNVIDDYE